MTDDRLDLIDVLVSEVVDDIARRHEVAEAIRALLAQPDMPCGPYCGCNNKEQTWVLEPGRPSISSPCQWEP